MSRAKNQPMTPAVATNDSRKPSPPRDDAEKEEVQARSESPSKTIIELENSLRDLQTHMDSAEEQGASLQNKISVLNKSVERYRKEAASLRGQIANLKDENTILKNNEKLQDQEMVKLKRLYSLADGEIKKLQKHCQGFESEIAKLRKENGPLKKEDEHYKRENSGLEKDKKSLNAEANRLKLSYRALEVENAGVNAQMSYLLQDLENRSSQVKQLGQENVNLNNMMQNMQRKSARHDKENESLIIQCSDLAREINGLRKQYQIDDDSTLKADVKSVHFNIRSWCIGFCDANTEQKPIIFSNFPSEPRGQSEHLWSATHEVNILTACVWEWILWLVLTMDPATEGWRDLWTDKETAQAIQKLELQLRDIGPEASVEWKCLTVAHLTRDKANLDQHRSEVVVDKIMEWCINSLNVKVPTRVASELKQTLHEKVVKRAIDFSIMLRRQLGVAELRFPNTLHDQVERWLAGGRSQNLSIFVQPELYKQSLSSMADGTPGIVLAEAVPIDMYMSNS